MSKKDSLTEYWKNRDFGKTTEPSGKRKKRKRGKKSIFVVQKHNASHLHYDFRLEVDDVLKSWAIPKGPSTDPSGKRLAVMTEDHPLDYADFEGVIPEGEYGAGTVLVWDYGTYDNIKEKNGEKIPMTDAVENGRVEVTLHGKKLKGGYAIIRTRMKGKKEQWLLIKMKDDSADARRNPVSTEPDSVKTGKSIEEIRKENAD